MRWTLLLLLLAAPALAGSRARFGGTLKVATAGKAAQTDPLLADTPLEAALGAMQNRALCRLERTGATTWVLSSEPARPSPTALRFAFRQPVDLGPLLTRLAAAGSPYRALLAPLKSAAGADVTLAFPFPDFERALCHPALAPPGLGPYRPANQTFTANPFYPEGRPFTDALSVTATDARSAERLLQQRKAHVALGLSTAADDASLLYATYLAFDPAKTGPEFRAAFEATVERSDLTRFFVLPPAAPMPQLLPPPLAGGMADPPKLVRPAPLAAPRELTLAYDAAIADHRAVAERLQVKLHASGYRIALRPLPRAQLRARALEHDLSLQSVLVPPVASLGLALALELGGRHDQLPEKLTALGMVTDDKARAHAAQALAEKLWPDLPLIPLYAQALGVQATREVQNLKTDAQGLPLLDAVFLGLDAER